MNIGQLSPVSQYLQAIKDEDSAALNHEKEDVNEQNTIQHLEKQAPQVDTVDQFLNNYNLRHTVLDTYGMKNLDNADYLIKKLLTQDPDSPHSLARTSNNATWLGLADAFKAWGQGQGSVQTTPFTKPLIDSINNAYSQANNNHLQQDISDFNMQAPFIHSVDDLLDPAHSSTLKVVLGAYGVSDLANDAYNGDGSINKSSVLYRLLTQPINQEDPQTHQPSSLAITSGNAKWSAFAAAFNVWGQNGGHDAQMMSLKNVKSWISNYLQNQNQTIKDFLTNVKDFNNSGSAQQKSNDRGHVLNFISQAYDLTDPSAQAPSQQEAFHNMLSLTKALSPFSGNMFANSADALDGDSTGQNSLINQLDDGNSEGNIHRLVRGLLGKSADQGGAIANALSSYKGNAYPLKLANKFFATLAAKQTPDRKSQLSSIENGIGNLYQQSQIATGLQKTLSFKNMKGLGDIKSLSDLFNHKDILNSLLSNYGFSSGDIQSLTSNLFNQDNSLNKKSTLYKILVHGDASGLSGSQEQLADDFSNNNVFNDDGSLHSGKAVFIGSDQHLTGLGQQVIDHMARYNIQDSDPQAAANILHSAHIDSLSDLFDLSDNASSWHIVSKAFNLPSYPDKNLQKQLQQTFGSSRTSQDISNIDENANWQAFSHDFAHYQQDTPISTSLENSIILRYGSRNQQQNIKGYGDVKSFVSLLGNHDIQSASDLLGADQQDNHSALRVMLGAYIQNSNLTNNLIRNAYNTDGSVNTNSNLYKLLTENNNQLTSSISDMSEIQQLPDDGGTSQSNAVNGLKNFSTAMHTWNSNGGHDTSLFASSDFRDEVTSDYQFADTMNEQTQEQNFSNSAPQLKTASDLLNNSNDLTRVTQRFGMDPQSDTADIYQMLLTQNPDSNISLAHVSGNKSWQALAHDFRLWGQNQGGTGGSTPFLSDNVNNILGQVKSQSQTQSNANATHFASNIAHIHSFSDLASDATSLNVMLTSYGLDGEFSSAFSRQNGKLIFNTSSQAYKTLQNLFSYDGNNPKSLAHSLGDGAVQMADDLASDRLSNNNSERLISSSLSNRILNTYRSGQANKAAVKAANLQRDFASLTNSSLFSDDPTNEGALASHSDLVTTLIHHFGLDGQDFSGKFTGEMGSLGIDTNSQSWKNISALISTDPQDSDWANKTGSTNLSSDDIQKEKAFAGLFQNYRLWNAENKQASHNASGNTTPFLNTDQISNIATRYGEHVAEASNEPVNDRATVADQNATDAKSILQNPGITSPQSLLSNASNASALNVILNAYGIDNVSSSGGDEQQPTHVPDKMLARTLMTQDPDDPQSLAQQSGRQSWVDFAKTFHISQNQDVSNSPFLSNLGHSVIDRYQNRIASQLGQTVSSLQSFGDSTDSVDGFIKNPQLGLFLTVFSQVHNNPNVATLGQSALNADGSVNHQSSLYKLLTQNPDDPTSLVYQSTHTQKGGNESSMGDFVNGISAMRDPKTQGKAFMFRPEAIEHMTAQFAGTTLKNLQQNVEHFQTNAATVTNAADLVNGNHPQILDMISESYGLNAQQNEHDLAKILLTQDPNSNSSVASLSGVPAWKNFADATRVWGASGGSVSPTPFTPKKLHSIISEYQRTQYEQDKANTKDGVGNALYFTRKIGNVKNIYQLMSDRKLLNVVEEVNGLDPDDFGALDFDEQTRILQKKVNFKDFSTPEKIRHYAERYLVLNQIHPQKQDKPETLMSLFGGSSDDDGILSLFGDTDDNSDSTLELFGISNSVMGKTI